MPLKKKSPESPGALEPFEPGFDPVTAGRYGLWLLGFRNHRAASRRRGLVYHVYNRSLADRFRGLLTPWRVHEYGGTVRLLAELCGVKEDSARQWCTGGQKLPAHQCRRLAGYLRGHAALTLALAVELEDVARAAERDRAMRPGNPGYVAGLAKWRREQALKKAGSRSGGCSSPNETESTWLGQRMHPTPRHRSAQDETS